MKTSDPMPAPELHTDEFTNRREAPAMSAIQRGYRIKVSYHPDEDDPDRTRTVGGTIRYAGYGSFEDKIEFIPDHTDNTWRLEITENGIDLRYRQKAGQASSWIRNDVSHLTTSAEISPVTS